MFDSAPPLFASRFFFPTNEHDAAHGQSAAQEMFQTNGLIKDQRRQGQGAYRQDSREHARDSGLDLGHASEPTQIGQNGHGHGVVDDAGPCFEGKGRKVEGDGLRRTQGQEKTGRQARDEA